MKIETLIPGIASAIGGGVLALLAAFLTARLKLKELEIQYLRQMNERKLTAANSKLEEVYVPIATAVEALERSWKRFQSSQEEEDKRTFLETSHNLSSVYDEIVEGGNSIYLVQQLQEEMEHLLRFLRVSRSSRRIRYVIKTKQEYIGMTVIAERVVGRWRFEILTMLYALTTVLAPVTFPYRWEGLDIKSRQIRVYGAPFDTPQSQDELGKAGVGRK